MKKRVENIYHFDVAFEANGDGYTVTVPAIPGLVTEGSTLSEARTMARDAIRCALEAVLKQKSFSRQSKHHVRKERLVVAL